MATSDAPITIGQVALTVRDLDKTAKFYEDVIGLGLIKRDGESALLGAENIPLFELRQDKNAMPSPNEAGLFHTAFLLPTRQDLGSWLVHASERGVRLEGASHHGVSEALYLNDPEGNGIEIYRDLPRDEWARSGNAVHMTTRPLDLKSLTQKFGNWTGVPKDTVIGHVHLRVGDVTEAANFITQKIGMVQTFQLPSARWFGSGGYHHHLAVNEWQSQGVGRRPAGTTGLASIELLAEPNVLPSNIITDPWGTEFKIIAAQSRAA
ncbi:VOC family protein [Cohaesibacter gelatinilyticus]|uniref:Catechol 2,3-dioxygenase n=1 Tax=Cohaesibacter gelatinilyticus TaxID=372072 RepID=A0A285PE04_9HYPH|nr:VOC family protein [Cohaesibacter gelatinilyticus]SNZ19473.1 catechol 2,3-dioxygenase [Cohaesibacter gelatinilyticus]